MKRFAATAAGLAFPLLCSLWPSARAGAQSPDTSAGRIVGRVLDEESGKPVPGVLVSLGESNLQRISDGGGNFGFVSVAPGVKELVVEHLAYGRVSRLVNVPPGGSVQLDLRLVPRAVALDSMVVQVTLRDPVMERGGYYDRKRAGWGYFLEGRDLERPSVTDIVRGAPRVDVLTGRSALDRYVRIRTAFAYCIPEIYVNHLYVPGGDSMLDEIMSPTDVKAVEVYRGIETPLEFVQKPHFKPCGAILIWTK